MVSSRENTKHLETGPQRPEVPDRASQEVLRASTSQRAATMGKYAVLFLAAFLALFPIVLIVSTALKTSADVRLDPFGLFTSVSLENIRDAWVQGGFDRYFFNTVRIAIPTVVGSVTLSTLAGYAFARCRFPGRELMFYAFMFGLMIPFFSIMIPLFFQLRALNLLDTYSGVILPLLAGANTSGPSAGLPFGVFLMRAFFTDLPEEMAEAARVDGASELQIFLKVMAPLALPGAAALSVFAFLQSWNTFLVPLLYLPGTENRPLATGLYLFGSGRTAEIGLLAAGTLFMIAPVLIVFLVAQRKLIQGLTAGSVMG